MLIGELLKTFDISRFKVFHEQSLFQPDWNLLKDHRCPICTNRLKFNRTHTIAMCRSKKHLKPFIITSKKLISLLYT